MKASPAHPLFLHPNPPPHHHRRRIARSTPLGQRNGTHLGQRNGGQHDAHDQHGRNPSPYLDADPGAHGLDHGVHGRFPPEPLRQPVFLRRVAVV
ncbi:hypothetical protein DL768_010918 [Monosporascus sp. mg162]|nr:hypothetical protein DL768_010918 [Monosporascus sp. mg162]